MKKQLAWNDPMVWVNGAITAIVLTLNYFYQSDNFNYMLKCICSGGFALMGIINCVYAKKTGQTKLHFYAVMAAGLIFAMLGDMILKVNFIGGAAVFAVGHLLFLVAYYFLEKGNRLDLAVCGVWLVGSCAFMLLFPLLDFGGPVMKGVCVAYAVIISVMLGKAIANFVKKRTMFRFLLMLGSFLFYFSDLMLVFELFVGIWDWAAHVCMAAYYPALCMLAFSLYVKAKTKSE